MLANRNGFFYVLDRANGQFIHAKPFVAVFSGTNEGHVFAADATSGKELWRYQLGAAIYAPPTTFMVDGRQYVVMPSGSTLTAFALPR